MKPSTITPLSFPTTVVIVDDSLSFLDSLVLHFDPELAFRAFAAPPEALAAVNSARDASAIANSCFAPYRERDDCDIERHVVDVDVNQLNRELFNPRRFESVSVVVVDYDMPGMNGLDFCQQIADPAVRKILLTGKADEHVAVQAFNAGLIDRYLRKQNPDTLAELSRAIVELQAAYFQTIGNTLQRMLTIGIRHFLFDPAVARLFDELRAQLGIVEHYLVAQPDGMLMLDRNGRAHLLLVQTDIAHRGQYEIAEAQDAPAGLLMNLRSREVVPYFWRTAGHYTPEWTDWKHALYPTFAHTAGDRCRCALVTDPAGFPIQEVLSYADFLREIDGR
jgi:CheY-like chemotaxis protein